MATLIDSENTVVFIGDSITDCDRRTDNLGLGNGFVRLFSDMLLAREPEKHIQIINRGISGETIADLQDRWQEDVMAHKPDWLIMLVGINDLHGWINSSPSGVSPVKYHACFRQCLQQTRESLPACQIVLMEPFYICQQSSASDFQTEILRVLPEYHKSVADMSCAFNTRVLRLHAIFANLLQHQPAQVYCPEPVHPNATGHMVIAQNLYEALWR